MSLHLHRAERADRLVQALGEMLSTPLPDPFATEIVSVPTPGVERWLAQRLSHQLGATPEQTDGICAGVAFPVAAPAGRAGDRRDRAGGRGRPVVADPPGLAAAAGDRPVPGRALGESALELSRRPPRADRSGRDRSGTRWPAVVDGAASGRPVRRVRRSTPGHDHQLGRGPRCRCGRAAAAARPGLAGRALAATAGRAGPARPGRAGRHRGRRAALGARAQRPARADLGVRPDPARA